MVHVKNKVESIRNKFVVWIIFTYGVQKKKLIQSTIFSTDRVWIIQES